MEHTTRPEKSNPMQFMSAHLQTLHDLPERKRKIFAVGTMIIAGMTVFLASPFLTSPLEDLTLSSPDNKPASPFADVIVPNEIKALPDNPQLADINNIPQIGPIKGFVEAFTAAKDLLVPADIQQASQGNISESWSSKLSQWVKQYAIKAKIAFQYLFDHIQLLMTHGIQKISSFIGHLLDRLISNLSRNSQ